MNAMRIFIILFFLSVSLSAFATQQIDSDSKICAPFQGGVVDPVIVSSMLQAAAENRLYRIQQKSSNVGFCVDSIIGRVEAEFKGIQGGLALRREVWGDESQMLVMVDANTLAMDDCFVKSMLNSEHFLDIETYPKILFVSSQINWHDHENATLEGMLTMHGVTKLVRFEVKMTTVANKDPLNVANIIVTAKSFINRADFGMDQLSFVVNNEIELCMRIEALLFKK
jgi:polyisoprenoid-binding protein YceI